MQGEYVLVETQENKATGKKGQLSDYLADLEKNAESSSNAKALLKEFKNIPFVCISNEQVRQKYTNKGYTELTSGMHNAYNLSGRIKKMYFVQVIDKDYEVYR